jgi:hypothetical protein
MKTGAIAYAQPSEMQAKKLKHKQYSHIFINSKKS